MSQSIYTILTNTIYGVMGVSGLVLIFFVSFMMQSKGNGLSAIANSNLSLFENVKSYGVEKKIQKICIFFTFLMFASIVGCLVIAKIGVK